MYHPDYFIGKGGGVRLECHRRLDILKKHIKGGWLLDLGCSEGFYSFGLADICKPIYAFDSNDVLINKAHELSRKHNLKIHFLDSDILSLDFADQAYYRCPSSWDNTLYMSVHHHIIEQIGMEAANAFIKDVSKHSRQMFFDMGQKNENCPQHEWHRLLPDTDDPEGWTREYLEKNTEYNDITKIGSSTIHGIQRILWKLANN